MGRAGSFRPERARITASATAVTASFWPITRRCSSSSRRRLLLFRPPAVWSPARRSSGSRLRRVYANAKWNKLLEVIGKLLGYIKAHPANHGMSNFKIAGPAMAKRADTMVIYCVNSNAADAIATLLLKLGDAFDMAVPEMTSRKDGRLGISTGAEPKWQATGLGPHMGAKYENNPALKAEHGEGSAAYAPQSFGTVRCQAIAAAILNFQMNLDQVSDTFEWFCKFVSVAFTGLGLDPTNPGD